MTLKQETLIQTTPCGIDTPHSPCPEQPVRAQGFAPAFAAATAAAASREATHRAFLGEA
jgi:hypothetical protein